MHLFVCCLCCPQLNSVVWWCCGDLERLLWHCGVWLWTSKRWAGSNWLWQRIEHPLVSHLILHTPSPHLFKSPPPSPLALFDISITNIDCRYIDTFEKYRYRKWLDALRASSPARRNNDTWQCDTVQKTRIHYNTIQYHTMQWNDMQYHAMKSNKIENYVISYNLIK